ncbi:MAG: RluA family pseudouridine synthase [Candidatus Babeliales bacterium]
MINFEKIDKIEKISVENQENIRLDKFLSSKFPEYSRTYFQDLITSKLILVNNKIIQKSNFVLKNGDLITINFPEDKKFDLTPKKVDFQIIDIQKDFIVINKPAGLIVHHSSKTKTEEITLVNGLLYEFQDLNKFSDKERPGIVHRIDKDTSGLLLVARNSQAQFAISKMFKDRKIHKTYLAVVYGHPPKSGKIDFSIGRHPFKRHLMSHNSYQGKPALTFYNVLEYYENSALVAVEIVTGRTHQIRVHFAAIGHGLLGDAHYGHKSAFISRQALHAHKISFEYKNQKYNYTAPIPQDFQDLLEKLR